MIYDTLIEVGLYVLFGISTLAFGGVTPGSIVLQEVLVALLALIYCVKILTAPSTRSSRNEKRISFFRFPSPFMVAMYGLLFVLLFQIVPLPRALVEIISPMTAQIYTGAAVATQTQLQHRLFLTIARRTTIMEFIEFLSYVAIFFLSLHIFRYPKRVFRMVSVLVFIGFFEALYGVLRVTSDVTSQSFSWARGSFVNRNHFAGYLGLIIPMALANLFLHFEKQRTHSAQMPEEKYMKSLFVLFMAFLMIGAIVLSGSRGGLIGFSVGMLGFAFLSVLRGLMKRWLAITLLVLGLVLGTFMLVNPGLLRKQTARLGQIEHSLQIRKEIWKSAWHIFQDFPLFGSGLGTYSHLSHRYKTFQGVRFFAHAHNDYLQFLAETGLLGSLMALGIGGSLILRVIPAWQRQESRQALTITIGGLSALLTVAVQSVFDFSLHIPSNMIVFCVIAAITYNSAHIRRHAFAGKRTPQATANGAKNRAIHPKRLQGAIFRFISAVVLLGGFSLYILHVVQPFRAMLHYQSGSDAIPEDFTTLDAARHQRILSNFQYAVRYAPDHAIYAHALGTYIHTVVTSTDPFTDPPLITGGFPEAEEWLTQAVLLDPANPAYYYALGQLYYSRGDCHGWKHYHSGESWDACPVTRYFYAALRNAPTHSFFQEAFGRWYAFYDKEQARHHLRVFLNAAEATTAIFNQGGRNLAGLLYDLQMDIESDRIASQVWRTPFTEPEAACQMNILVGAPDSPDIVIGADDGTAEWSAQLTSEADRVKKQFCLPADMEAYQRASLLIYANRGSERNFTLIVGIDGETQEISGQILKRTPAWHEIPIDASWFTKKSLVRIYLRTRGIRSEKDAMVIWGDTDTSKSDSEYNFHGIADLSADPGQQTGEYMIRLRLQKSGPSR